MAINTYIDSNNSAASQSRRLTGDNAAGAARAVAVVGADGQRRALTHAHLGNALVPALGWRVRQVACEAAVCGGAALLLQAYVI